MKAKTEHLWKFGFIYIAVFAIVYFALMLVRYKTGSEMTWLKTFVFMFSTSAVYLLLRSTGSSKGEFPPD